MKEQLDALLSKKVLLVWNELTDKIDSKIASASWTPA